MNSYDRAVLARLAQRIASETETHTATVMLGGCDPGQYREACGYVKALQAIRVFLDEIQSDIQRG